jgi:hypothetical protein
MRYGRTPPQPSPLAGRVSDSAGGVRNSFDRETLCESSLRLGGTKFNPILTKLNVGLRKAFNVTCYNAGYPRNAVTPQTTNYKAIR